MSTTRRAYQAAYNAAYYAANKEKVAARDAAYYAANKEKIAAHAAAYNAANKEKIAARDAAYNAANKEKIAVRAAAYRVANREREYARATRRRARKLDALAGDADHAAIAELHREAALAAAFMGAQFDVDHIVPLSREGEHHHDNLRILPARLNYIKGTKLDEEVKSTEFHAWLDPRPTFEQVTFRSFHPKRNQPIINQ